MERTSSFERGSLWSRISQTTDEALRTGALKPIPTKYEFLEHGGVRFFVRRVANLARKSRDTDRRNLAAKRTNPFLPFDPALHVADVSDSHVCLLNKFNVTAHHALIVTRDYEDQEACLNERDFAALWTCLVEFDSLGFYNSGTLAGASQPHKHLQMVPLPLAPEGPRIPTEAIIEKALKTGAFDGEVGRTTFPFLHALASVDPELCQSPSTAARVTEKLYRSLLHATGLDTKSEPGRVPGAYNLLVTREWMLLVPRSREDFASISLNSLAFAGALLVRDRSQLALLKERGPMTMLSHVTLPEPSQA